jgi:L-ascorbate metabolism protein UlaG (beta-lactamase superfamily)
MSDVRFTHIGGPTVLIEVAGWRILTDPTFDPPGRRYSFGWGTASTKQAGAALPAQPRHAGPRDAAVGGHGAHHRGRGGRPGRQRRRPGTVGHARAAHWEGQEHGQLWVSGDTVLYDGVREVPDRLDVGTVLLHLGSVQFGITGPLRYTMTGAEGAELCVRLQPHTVLPVHYEGWSHFQEGRPGIEAAFAAAAPAVRDTLHWLTIGKPGTVTV